MERQRYIGIIVILLLCISTVWASPNKKRIYDAYIGNNMNNWKTIIDEMERSKTSNTDILMELVNFQYGYIGYCLGNEKIKEAEKHLSLAEENLKNLEKADGEASLISAYQSAFYGFSIGLNKMKAPFIGPKSVKCAKLAMVQNPDNPMGYIQYGNSQFYMPFVFGGSKAEAVAYFQKAEKLMEKNKMQMQNDWNHMSLLVLIGQSYTEMKDYKNAKIYYEKALAVEPDFSWVKLKLMPELVEKMK